MGVHARSLKNMSALPSALHILGLAILLLTYASDLMTESSSPSPASGGDVTRRQFLTVSLVTVAGAAAVRLAALGLDFYQPAVAANQYGGVFELGPLDDLPAAGEPPLHHAEGRFYLVHTEAGLLALHKVCTHLDCLLAWDEPGRRFLCPCHGSQFAVDGQVLSGPAARSLNRFAVRMTTTDGTPVAETDPTTAVPLAIPTANQSSGNENAVAGSDASPNYGEPAALLVWVDTGRKISSVHDA